MTRALLPSACVAAALALTATPAWAQTAASRDLSLGAAPTAAVRRETATSGYGDPTRGGRFLNPRGQAGSIGLSANRETAAGGVTLQPRLGGARALGMKGYGHASAGAATAFKALPTPVEAVDPTPPASRRARAILPGATLPQVGP